jgi:hypothetical protein
MSDKYSNIRRGVLLLLVLAILALFALVAVAFVLISGQSQRSAKNMQRVDQTLEDPQKLLSEAMMQVARGPSNPVSVLGPHSLLEDMYGNNFVIAHITVVSAVAGGQLIEFTYQVSSDNTMYPPSWVPIDPDPQHRLGCVLTFLDPPFMGESTRIVGRNPTSGNYQLLAAGPVTAGSIMSETRVLINGTPFSGTGFGFNPTTGKLDAWDPNGPDPSVNPGQEWQYALLPNPAAFSSNNNINYKDPAGPGGANEDYDAADFQNMLLAAQIVDPTTGNVKTLPSLHRPALVNYWNTTRTSDWNSNPDPAVQKFLHRKVILRPTREYHPNFTGSNTNPISPFGFDPIIGPWDVDNDGDGVADSVWVDLGLPVRAAKDGKLYKPLFAILCLDMDGRLNLNAHGSLTQTDSGYYTTTGPSDGTTNYTADYFAGSTLPTIARGRGFGPADINPNYVLQNLTLYQQLLTGNTTLGYEGRYGSDQVPGVAGSAYFSNIGVNPPDTFSPSVLAYNDYLSANKWFEFDGLYQNSATQQTATGMKSLANFKVNGELPDPEGKGVLGLDPAGRPILQSIWGSNFLDLPYEANLGRQTARGLPSFSTAPDNPFSVDELERILRPFDRDAAQLPARLAALTSPTGLPQNSALINKRHEVTTESWDLPVYTAGLPTYIQTQVQNDLAADTTKTLSSKISWLPPHNVTDLLKAYYYYRLVTGGTPAADAATQADSMVNSMSYVQLTALFPPEMLAGLKMNINHPFPGPGNGASNDPNAYGMAALWQSVGVTGSYGEFWFGQIPDYPDGTPDANNAPFAARQRYARYLYVLAMLLRDPGSYAQWFTEAANREELTKRRIAQWAINAACFKVNDSIMVPFEYDTDPFAYNTSTSPYTPYGWRVDGVLTTDENLTYPGIRGLVWGCKPPELILTETLAFHDRRIADTAWDENPLDTGKNTTTQDTNNKDIDYDQTRIPQGSAFFELYCPRDLHGSIPPSDLYTYDSNTSTWFLNLGKMAPAGSGVPAYPVWRMLISESKNKNKNNNVLDRLNGLNDFAGAGKPDSLSFEPELYRGQPGSNFSLIDSSEPTVSIDRIVWFCSQAPTTNHHDYDRIYYNYAGASVLLDRGHYAVVGPRKTTVLGLNSDKSDTANYPLGKPSLQQISIQVPQMSIPELSDPSPQVTDINGMPDTNIDQNKIKMPVLGIIVGGYPSGWNTPVGISISEPLFSSASYYPQPTVAGADKYEVKDYFNKTVKEWYGDPKMMDTTVGYFLNTPLDKNSTRPLGDSSEKLPYAGTEPNYKTVFLQRLANPLAPYDPTANPYLTVDWMPIDLTIFNGEDLSTNDPDAAAAAIPSKTTNFATRQRGGNTPSADFNIWKPESGDPDNSSTAGSTANFDYNLAHSLGYLNKAFQPFITGSTIGYNGDPSTKPFPWLPWFGRPYVSQLELMLVPGSHPARLLWEFQPCTGSTDNYTPGDVSQAPFPQLLNFLQAGTAMNQFGRILDYVGVPSWFEGTEIQVNPTAASAPISAPGSHTFFPPYNRISTYREPGRINLNTIYSQDVFNALMNGVSSPKWFDISQPSDFVRNRRGYGISGDILEMDPNFPSQFGSPFRSSGGVFWNPIPSASNLEINATYMRQNSALPKNPLFQYASSQDVDNTDRNPFFHYSDLMRLGNLATTRSNVYSVWITVGYFEVTPWSAGVDAAHSDGYQLGQELGSDTGEIVRHRAFYMIDRTIPVGFQRGQDLNVEKAIILKKYIE